MRIPILPTLAILLAVLLLLALPNLPPLAVPLGVPGLLVVALLAHPGRTRASPTPALYPAPTTRGADSTGHMTFGQRIRGPDAGEST